MKQGFAIALMLVMLFSFTASAECGCGECADCACRAGTAMGGVLIARSDTVTVLGSYTGAAWWALSGNQLVIGLKAPDEQTAIVRPPVAHHFLSGIFQKIRRREIAVENLRQAAVCLPRRRTVRFSRKRAVNRAPIGRHGHRHVLGPLHAPFQFDGADPGFFQFRESADQHQISRRQQIAFFSAVQCIPHSAGLCTLAPVSAPPADHA